MILSTVCCFGVIINIIRPLIARLIYTAICIAYAMNSWSLYIYICYSKCVYSGNMHISRKNQVTCIFPDSLRNFVYLLKMSGNIHISWNLGAISIQIYWLVISSTTAFANMVRSALLTALSTEAEIERRGDRQFCPSWEGQHIRTGPGSRNSSLNDGKNCYHLATPIRPLVRQRMSPDKARRPAFGTVSPFSLHAGGHRCLVLSATCLLMILIFL